VFASGLDQSHSYFPKSPSSQIVTFPHISRLVPKEKRIEIRGGILERHVLVKVSGLKLEGPCFADF
jgi:hypothetical protein